MIRKIEKSEEKWKQILAPQVFAVTRGAGTEPAFHNAYWDNEAEGLYQCSNCGLTLFDSKDKFDSGTGWPSFSRSFKAENVDTKNDFSLGVARVEALCARCGSHLGHVFDDGPEPSGLRFCMNSAALNFVKK